MEISFTLDSRAFDAKMRAILGGRAIDKAAANAFRRTARAAVAAAIADARGKGVLRTLFGQKPSGLRKIVRVSRMMQQPGLLVIPLKASGLAAMVERGGIIRPHEIKPKGTKVLKYAGPQGLAFAKFVKHPGGPVPRDPFLTPQAQKVPQAAIAEIRVAIDKLWNATGAGA